MLPADRYFAALREEDDASTAIWEALTAAGIDHEDFDCDGYDGSIEIRGSKLSELTADQQAALWRLGYLRAWLHGVAGERYYVANLKV